MARETATISWFKKNIGARFPESRFARSVAILAGSAALGQTVTVLASPILTRLYTPDDFGVLAVYSSILGILSVVAGWRYELAIPLPEKDEDAVNLMALSLGIVALMSFLTGLGAWFLRGQIVHWVRTPALQPYLWFLFPGVLLLGGYQIFNHWAVRKQAFGEIAKTRLYQGLGATVAQVIGGFINLGALGLIAGQVIGQSAGLITLIKLALKDNTMRIVNKRQMLYLARRYQRFPQCSSFSSVINAAGLQLPALLLGSFYGPQVVGWFVLTQRVLGVPMNMVGQAISQVYMGTGSRLVNRDVRALYLLFIKTALRLLLIGIVPLGILTISGPWLFVRVFGSNWESAGHYLQVLSLAFLAQFVIVPLSQTANMLEYQDWQLRWDIFRLILVVLSITATFVLGGSSWHAVLAYSLSMVIAYGVLFVMNLMLLDHMQMPDVP